MKSNGLKTVYRYISFLLCILLTFASPMTSAAAGVSPGSYTSFNNGENRGGEAAETYSVTVQRYTKWSGIYEEPTNSGTNIKLQIDGKALIKKNTDGTYHVRLGYAGYNLYDMVQVIDPKQNAAVFDYIEKAGLSNTSKLPNGTFDAPDTADACKYPERFDTIAENTREEVNGFYLQGNEISITCLDSVMDWGGIEFDIDDLSGYVIINPFTTITTSLTPVVIGFDESSLSSVHDSLTYQPGTYEMGYEWTNYFNGMAQIGKRGDEVGDITTLNFLNNIFEKNVTVHVADDGTMSAVLSVNMDIFNEADPVYSIELAKSRDTSVEGNTEILGSKLGCLTNEVLGVTWDTEFLVSDQHTVTIPFDHLLDGKVMRITTVSQKTANEKKTELTSKYYWGRLWLKEAVTEEATEVVVKAENGAVLKTDSDTFKDGYQFVCVNTAPSTDEATRDQALGYAKDDDSYCEYSYRIEDGEGNPITPVSSVTIDLPIPEQFNQESTIFFAKDGKGSNVMNKPSGSEVVQDDEGNWVLRIIPKDLTNYEYEIIMLDSGTGMTWNEMQETFDKGKYYEVRATLGNSGYANKPSMCSALLYGRKAVLHVTDDGEYELYMTMQGVLVAEYGHMARMYYYTSDGSKYEAETLAYKTTANIRDVEWENLQTNHEGWKTERSEDDLTIDPVAEEYDCHYLHVVKIPLNNPGSKSYWKTGFVVPLMNKLTVSDPSKILTAEKETRLNIISGSAKEVDASECPGYDKSLLLGTIEDARSYYNTYEGTEKDSLKGAIEGAEAAYQELKADFDTDRLLAAVNTLKEALTAAGGGGEEIQLLSSGTYNLPLEIYKTNNDNEISETISPYNANFEHAVLTVDNKTMTVSLNTKEADGVSITGLQYNAGSGNYREADAIYDDGGNAIGYTFTRSYEEEPFRLQLSLSSVAYPVRVYLSMDFKNAEKITATEAEVAQLTSLVEELNALLEKEDSAALYTAASLGELSMAVKNARTVIDTSDSLESSTVQMHISRLTTAKEGLILKSEVQELLRAAVEDAKGYISGVTGYTEQSLAVLQAAVNAAETVYGSYDGSEAAIANAETAMNDLEEAIEGLILQSRQDLEDFMENMALLDAADFSDDSWAALETAMQSAQNILDSETALDDELKSGLESLKTAYTGLVFTAYEDLKALIDSCKKLVEEDYTESSWAQLEEALAGANEIYEKQGPAKEELETACRDLETAIDKLKKESGETSGPMKELEELVESLEAYDSGDYEASSWAAFEASLEAAGEILNGNRSYEVSDSQVNAQIKALEKERDALIETDSLAALIRERMLSFYAVSYDPELEEEEEPGETAKETAGNSQNQTQGTGQKETDDETVSAGNGTAGGQEEESGAGHGTGDGKEDIEADESAGNHTNESESGAGTEEKESENGHETEDSTEDSADAPTDDAKENVKEDIKEDSAEEEDSAPDDGKADEKESQSDETSDSGKEDKDSESSDSTPALSRSLREYFLLMSTATPSNAEKTTANTTSTQASSRASRVEMDDGIYAIDYILWQFATDSVSMGNPALSDSYPELDGKQAKLEIKSGKAYLYLELQKMSFDGQIGHLLEMIIMDNLVLDEDGEVIVSFTELAPTIMETTDEKDNYGPPSGKKYPKLLKFNVTNYIANYKSYIPVRVNVPVMGASAEQPAYLLVDFDSLYQVEGDEETDEPEIVADFTKLNEAVKAASKLKGNYTKASYHALEKTLEAAVELQGYAANYQITQELVDKRAAAVTATANALIETDQADSGEDNPSDNPDDSVTESAERKALGKILVKVAGYKQSDYTAATYDALMNAYEEAYLVYEDEDATALELKLAKSSLEKAIGNLKADTVKKTKLTAAVNTADKLEETNFTTESWTRFIFALDGALAVLDDPAATQEEVDSAWEDLSDAIDRLAGKTTTGGSVSTGDSSSSSDNSGSDEDDGYYKVSVRLWHSSMNKASMGDSAVVKTAYVHIDDGDITMRLVTKKMTVSGISAHLHNFWIYEDGDYQDAELVSTENSKWIYEFDLPNDSSTYYKCKVDPQVDVMGDDPVKARLKVTWSSLKEVDEDDWDDLTGDVDDDDDDSSSGSSKAKTVDLTSAETGIQVSGNTGGPGMVLEASRHESGESYDRAAGVLGDKVNRFVLYDINLRSGTSYVQPAGSVTIRIPVPGGYDNGKLILYRVNDDGSVQEISGKVNGSYFEASVDHFSLYALAESDHVQAVAAAAAGTSNSTAAAGSSKSSTATTKAKAGTSASKKELTGSKVPEAGSPAYMAAGRAIPYTGDTMPVKELMAMGLLALLISLGTMIPQRGRKSNIGKRGQAG